jgi:hypothetical protein
LGCDLGGRICRFRRPVATAVASCCRRYSAEFNKIVSGSLLDEDDGIDEIMATVRQYIPLATVVVNRTGQVRSAF